MDGLSENPIKRPNGATLAAPELKEAIYLPACRPVSLQGQESIGSSCSAALGNWDNKEEPEIKRYAVSVLYCMQQMPWNIRN